MQIRFINGSGGYMSFVYFTMLQIYSNPTSTCNPDHNMQIAPQFRHANEPINKLINSKFSMAPLLESLKNINRRLHLLMQKAFAF